MNRTIDARILIIGLIIVCSLLVRPFERLYDEPDSTGSIPTYDDPVQR